MAHLQTLTEFLGIQANDFNVIDEQDILASTAHVIIDAQRYFADPTYQGDPNDPYSFVSTGDARTDATSDKIAALAPEFREAGIQTCLVYFRARPHEGPEDGIFGGWHKIQPDQERDIIAGKMTSSAFKDPHCTLEDDLKSRGIKNILISGFNTNVCVFKTAKDALARDFNVCVIDDLTENGKDDSALRGEKLQEIENEGAYIAHSDEVMDWIGGLSQG